MARVLVIDDSAVAIQFITAALKPAGHIVEPLSSFIHLAATVRDDPPDLVVLDLHMPALSGVSMGQLIRKYQAHDVPILIYSSRPEKELREASRAIGARGWVQKSSAGSELVLAVENALSARRKTARS